MYPNKDNLNHIMFESFFASNQGEQANLDHFWGMKKMFQDLSVFWLPTIDLWKLKRYHLKLYASIFMHSLHDKYYVAYKPITLSCIPFMFIKIKFTDYHSCVLFVMKFMGIYNN